VSSRSPFRAWSALLAALVLGLIASAPARATLDQDAIARVEAYLNGIGTLRADFVQVADDGGIAEGILYIARPGKLRIEYKPPVMVLIVADGRWLTFVDYEVDQMNRIAIDKSLAGFLIRDHLRLGGDIQVTAVDRGSASLRITLVRRDAPDEGSLTLVFSDRPLALRQWVVIDAQGYKTRITLENVDRDLPLDPSLFVPPPPFPASGSGR